MIRALLVIHAVLALHVTVPPHMPGRGMVCFAGSTGCKQPASRNLVCFANDVSCTKRAHIVAAPMITASPHP